MPVSPAGPSDFEQLMLEYINRARLDPSGEAAALIGPDGTGVQENIASAMRFFGVDTEALVAQTEDLAPVAPLAWNGALADAAEGHSELLIEADTQSHRVEELGEAGLGDRVVAAGYEGMRYVRENVYSYAKDPLQGHAGFFIDWGGAGTDADGDGMQDRLGHRNAILSDEVEEIGIGVLEAPDGLEIGPWVVTQNFGRRAGYEPQLTGVVIADADGDSFYDMGEGLGGITVTAQGEDGQHRTTTWASGGYQMALPEGDYALTFSGGALEGVIRAQVTMGAENVKLDAMAGGADPVGRMVAGGAEAEVLAAVPGQDQVLIGNGGADTLTGADGDDVLLGDAYVPAMTPGIAGQVYRLYLATLDRAPDAGGHLNWSTRLLSEERSLPEVATGFVGSPEFQATYGALDTAEFVTLLYRNVLDREPDAQGLANWSARLDGGMTRPEVVLGFSESAEFRQSTAPAAAGFAAGNDPAAWHDDVYRLYRATLGREPELGGLENWSERLAGGRDYLEVVAGFTNSAEFTATYGDLDDEGFVQQLYENVLGRSGDLPRIARWVQVIEEGSRAEVVRGFAQSPEYRFGTADDLAAWMRGQGQDDRLESGEGAELMAGGGLSDLFVFAAGGDATITDFEPWDMLQLEGTGLGDAAAARDAFRQAGNDLLFEAGDSTLTLLDTADLTEAQITLA